MRVLEQEDLDSNLLSYPVVFVTCHTNSKIVWIYLMYQSGEELTEAFRKRRRRLEADWTNYPSATSKQNQLDLFPYITLAALWLAAVTAMFNGILAGKTKQNNVVRREKPSVTFLCSSFNVKTPPVLIKTDVAAASRLVSFHANLLVASSSWPSSCSHQRFFRIKVTCVI